jgi:hypothetical protein
MNANSVILRRFAALFVLAALCALLYFKFLRSPEPSKPVATSVTPAPPQIAALCEMVNQHIDSIFSSIETDARAIPEHEFRTLRESFADFRSKAPLGAQAMYETAVQLCDTLLFAIQERERTALRFTDIRLKADTSAELMIVRHWSAISKTCRDRVVNLYTLLRNQERQLSFTTELQQSMPESRGTITLAHPTTVHFRYGSGILPSGLALRVVERNAIGTIVDYSGELVALPSLTRTGPGGETIASSSVSRRREDTAQQQSATPEREQSKKAAPFSAFSSPNKPQGDTAQRRYPKIRDTDAYGRTYWIDAFGKRHYD